MYQPSGSNILNNLTENSIKQRSFLNEKEPSIPVNVKQNASPKFGKNKK
jgi:hypothetical protein